MKLFSALALVGLFAAPLFAADAVDPVKASGLVPAQFLSGLKTGLGAALDFAAGEVAKPGAFQMPVPSSMAKLESAVKKLNQTGALDSFKASLNAAAASVAPQTTGALKESIAGLTLQDAASLTSGTPDAATKMLRKAAEPALRTKLLPLVAQAIAANGTMAKAKELSAKAGPMAAMLGLPGTADIENYVFTQMLDTTFGYLGKGEAAFRANPATFTDKLAAKVFGPPAK